MGKPLRILMVEDSAQDAALILMELRKAGIVPDHLRVETAADLRAALTSASWDLILSDYAIGPDFTGLAVVAVRNEVAEHVPVILVSGTAGEDVAVSTMRAGADDYVRKDSLKFLPPMIARALKDIQTRLEQKQSDELYRTLVDNIALGITVIDADYRVLMANAAQRLLSGKSESELRGRQCFSEFAKQDAVCDYCPGPTAMATGRPSVAQAEGVRADGSRCFTLIRAFALPGVPPRFVEVVEDITDRRNLEEQFRQAQKLEAVGQLAGGVAHDFNNILMAQMGYCDLMKRALKEDDPLAKDLAQVRICADRAAVVTRQLLAFSRKQVLQPQVLDLNAVVGGMEEMLRRLIGEDIEFVTTLADGLGMVKADPGQIEHVIMNLAVNARDAMPRGGTLNIETGNVHLDESYAQSHTGVTPGPHVMLAVTDNGCGMDEETQSRLFEPFFTTKPRGKGTGLGLAMVYGIAKQSGAHLWVYSEPGMGTVFKMYLPRVEAQPAPRTRRETRSARGQGELILLAEDDPVLRELLSRLIEELGYRAKAVAAGDEALLAVERDGLKPDLLIADIVMPDMSGPALAERLRRLQPGLKVLFSSGYPSGAIGHHGELDPDTPFLAKPFSDEDLAAKIHEILHPEG